VLVCAPLKSTRSTSPRVEACLEQLSDLSYAVQKTEEGIRPLAKAALQLEAEALLRNSSGEATPHRRPNVIAGTDRQPAAVRPISPPTQSTAFQIRVPVITGEATYRGCTPVDGLISGQLTANGGGLTIKQRVRSNSEPELDGELSFRDMLRINGHVRGSVQSKSGTLIVADEATVDACIDVAIAIIGGEVNGDVYATERVELGPRAVINGNISTPNLSIKPGATFHGDCSMLKTAG